MPLAVLTTMRLAVASIALAPTLAPAHPASVFLPKKSLVDKIEKHEAAVLARPTRLEAPVYRVTSVLKSTAELKRGEILGATLSRDPEAPETIENLLASMLLTRPTTKDEWVVQSPAGLHLTPFFRKVVALPDNYEETEESYRERLRFFLPLLAHPDTRIANCAVAAIGRAPYAVVRGLRSEIDREQIRGWIGDPAQKGWRSLQYALLGVGGNKDDATYLRERIDRMWVENEHTDLASLLVAYIQLEGRDAARHIVNSYVKDRDRTFSEIKQALTALAMQGDERDPLPLEDVIESFGWLLENRPPLAYLVVPDYLRWEHWEVMPKLVQLAGQKGYHVPFLRKRVIEYLRACPSPAAKGHLTALTEQ